MASMPADTSRTIEIENSPVKLIGLSLGCLLFAVLGAAIAFGYIHTDPRAHVRWVGWFCLAFFGLCFAVGMWRLFGQRGPVVTIARDGIRDTRVAAEFIPWRAIGGISTWRYRQQNVMVLAVDPAVERTLTLTRAARWSRGANRALGADGLCVAATGLKTNYDTLLSTSMAYWQARRPA